jgi:uncharacterized membrane protein YfcA
LNAFFLFGALASVGALLMYRLIDRSDLALSVALLPAIWLGTVTGDVALKRLTIRSLRPFTLIISVIAAVALILRTCGDRSFSRIVLSAPSARRSFSAITS